MCEGDKKCLDAEGSLFTFDISNDVDCILSSGSMKEFPFLSTEIFASSKLMTRSLRKTCPRLNQGNIEKLNEHDADILT